MAKRGNSLKRRSSRSRSHFLGARPLQQASWILHSPNNAPTALPFRWAPSTLSKELLSMPALLWGTGIRWRYKLTAEYLNVPPVSWVGEGKCGQCSSKAPLPVCLTGMELVGGDLATATLGSHLSARPVLRARRAAYAKPPWVGFPSTFPRLLWKAKRLLAWTHVLIELVVPLNKYYDEGFLVTFPL